MVLTVRLVHGVNKRVIRLHVSPTVKIADVKQRLAKEADVSANKIFFSLEGRSLSSLDMSLAQAYAGASFGVVLDAVTFQGKEDVELPKMSSLHINPSKFAFSPVRGEEANEELRCPICHDSVLDPVEMPCCRKLFCRERCLVRPGFVGGACPWCRTYCEVKGLLEPNRSILNMLSDIRVSCDRCKEVVFRGSKGERFEAHLRVCKGKEAGSVPLQAQTGSIQQAIREGELGKLLDALDEIRTHLKECSLKIEFPTVVVCGQESTGKSSVLERICMFPFFPRGHGITTRMPISLRLRFASSDDLQVRCASEGKNFLGPDTLMVRISFSDNESRVYVLSASNPDDASTVVKNCQSYVLEKHSSNKSFCQDPLILEAWGEALPDLDVVDLPGVYSVKVQNESFDIVEATRKITLDYLSRPSTLVVAVVPATADRIRNDVVLGMVQRAGKEDLTVCALTKADKCHRSEYNSSDPFMDLKERARGTADDCPSLGGGFVALRNRDSREAEDVSLASAAERERSWFLKFMPDLVKDGCATADCLVKKIGDLMTRYTRQTWSVNALSQIETHRSSVMRDLQALGEDPMVNPEGLFKKLLDFAKERSKSVAFGQEIEKFVRARTASLDISSVTGRNARSDPEGALLFKKQSQTLKETISNMFSEIPEFLSNKIFGKAVFDQWDAVDNVKVKRFEGFKSALFEAFNARLMHSLLQCRQRWAVEYPMLIVAVTINDSSLSMTAERLCTAILLQELDLSVPSKAELVKIKSLDEMLVESCAEQRHSMKLALEALDRAKQQLQVLQWGPEANEDMQGEQSSPFSKGDFLKGTIVAEKIEKISKLKGTIAAKKKSPKK